PASRCGAPARSGVPRRVAGDGPLRGELRALATRTGAPVELLGRVSSGDAADLIASAAMVVVPSVGPDVMPFAALEAMAAGVPVVAARTGSLPEILGEERCVPRRAPDALAAAMTRLWGDPALRRAEGDPRRPRPRRGHSADRHPRDL